MCCTCTVSRMTAAASATTDLELLVRLRDDERHGGNWQRRVTLSVQQIVSLVVQPSSDRSEIHPSKTAPFCTGKDSIRPHDSIDSISGVQQRAGTLTNCLREPGCLLDGRGRRREPRTFPAYSRALTKLGSRSGATLRTLELTTFRTILQLLSSRIIAI